MNFKDFWKTTKIEKTGKVKYFLNPDGFYTVRYYDLVGNFEHTVTVSSLMIQRELQNALFDGYQPDADEDLFYQLLSHGFNPQTAEYDLLERSMDGGRLESRAKELVEDENNKKPVTSNWGRTLIKIALVLATEFGISLAAALNAANKYKKNG